MIDVPTEGPPTQDPGSTLRPVEPAAPPGETSPFCAGRDVSTADGPLAAREAAGRASLKVISRRIQVRKLGPYELLGLLGRGGMGAVYEGFDTRLNRRVAVKVMQAGDEGVASWHSHATQEERERFRREAAHAARLRHPSIVPVHDVGHAEGRDYLVMDLVEGVTLGAALRQRQFTYREKAALLEKVARAVQYAHDQGVVHRDLKPGNIMLDYGREGSSSVVGRVDNPPHDAKPDMTAVTPAVFEPLVMDFGLAKDIQQGSALSRTGQPLGTPAYMAPEQAEGKGQLVGPRSDVYSLGAILYELLAGRAPFAGETPLQVMRAAISDDPVPPRVVTPGVPRDLETICLKCLEKDPARRYASAAAFANDLRAWLNDEPISARRVGSAERAWKKVRRNPAPYVVAAAALLVIVSGTGGFMYSLNQKRRDAESALARFVAEKEAKERAESQRIALEKEKNRVWQLVFEDDFSDPAKFAENWEVASRGGQWELKDGELHVWGPAPQVAILKKPVMGDVRLEFECRLEGDWLSDVSCFLAGTKAGLGPLNQGDGYEFQYGGNANTSNSIWRDGAIILEEKAAPLAKGQRYRACAENAGGHLRYTVNGQVVLDLTDKSPMSGPERAFAALEGYSPHTYWSNVKLYRLTEARSADLLDVAARQLERANAVAAEALYQEVLDSANDPARRAAAKEGLEKAGRLAPLQYKLAEYQDRVRNAWPKGNAHLTATGLVVDISGCGVNDLGPLRGLPITELRCNANEITSLEPLRDMPLRVLDCNTNSIRSLEPLTGMKLSKLTCGGNPISDLAPLAGMPLAELDCYENDVTTLEPLRNMCLTRLSCGGNQVTSLEPLAGMRLVWLSFSGNSIRSLEPLRGMPLTWLSFGHNQITTLEPLRGMPLTKLYCSLNQITSLEPLRGTPLNKLEVYNNRIASLEPLRGMDLDKLYCQSNQISSLDPLRGMPLGDLDCGENPLRSLTPFVDAPPEKFLFGCDTLTDQELQRLREVWSVNARHAPHARMAAAFLAWRRKDKAALLALSQEFRGHHYLLAPQVKPWNDALEMCQKVGGHLLTISDGEENRLAQRLAGWGTVWIGLNWRNGKVAWVTGEPVLFDSSRPGWRRIGDVPRVLCADGKWEPWGMEVSTAFIIEWDE